MSTPEHEAATACARRGWSVMPSRGKLPLTARGLKDATTDTRRIDKWWRCWPDAGVAIRTGRESGLLVLDVDGEEGGDSLHELEREHGELPRTASVRTPRGGSHFYFAHPGGAIRNSAGKLGPGLDVRGDGGYVVAPPSLGANGGRYEPDEQAPVAEAPAWLVELLRGGNRRNGPAPRVAEAIPEGSRNATLASLAGTMRRRGMDEAAIAAALRVTNTERCRPPLEDAEVERIAASVGRYEPASRGETEPKADADAPFALALDEFIAARSELPPALIGDAEDVLLPAAGFLILGGKGGKGKTTLMVDAAFHLASGRDWLGFKVPRPLRVLVIENEGPQEMFRRKVEAKRESWPHEIAGGIFIYTLDWGGLDLRDEEGRRQLREFVAEHGIDVIFGDPLDSCGLEGVGSPEDTRAFMALAKEVGLHRSVAFWFCHHPRKEKADDELEELSGAWGGRPDSVLMLSLLAGERSRLAIPKVRWTRRGKRPALILSFDADTEGFELVAEEGEERDYVAEIEDLLGDGEWRTLTEIKAPKDKGGIGGDRTNIEEALTENLQTFVSRSGDEVGRSARATVWGLA